MGKQQTFIEVNGKRYDTRTGKLIASPAQAKVPAKPAARVMTDVARPAAKPVARTPQRSQTLMRAGVKRPATKPKVSVSKTTHRTVSDFRTATRNAAKLFPARSEAERQARAASIKQSKLVRRFGDLKSEHNELAVKPRVETLPVQPAPESHKPLHLHPSRQVESLIEKGLKNAQSHAQPAVKQAKKRRGRSKLASLAAGSLAALLLGGFIAYQNMPNLSIRYASARSGVEATLPSYAPSGFTLGSKIQYNPGQIVVNFSSNTDERGFTITQRESNWNSDTLMSNYVATSGEPVQKYEDKGRTIYLYGESNATWVNGGIWYDIKGDSQLTSDQLIRIATSM